VTMPMGDDYRAQGGDRNVPVPDPTRLTTQLVDRALAAFREVMETRLAGMDLATKLATSDIDKLSSRASESDQHIRDDMDRQLEALREFLLEHINRVSDVASEKFSGIDTRFMERDARTAQAADESRISLDAALAAAKEAVSEQNKANTLAIGKSEAATQKQIDAMAAQMNTQNKALEDKIADLKGRADRAPGEMAAVSKVDTRLDRSQLYLAIGLVISIVSIAIGLVLGLR